jgi:DNA-binding PadR family transcriptional regulator
MRRGDIRTAVLAVLAEGPGHGYDVIQRLEDKTGGAWRPSPGSVYPTLQLLADEGLAQSVERDGKRVYELTDSGRAETERRIEEAGGTPWELETGDDANLGELRDNLRQLHTATRQVAATGRPDQVERAVAIVRDARKQLYGMLAED